MLSICLCVCDPYSSLSFGRILSKLSQDIQWTRKDVSGGGDFFLAIFHTIGAMDNSRVCVWGGGGGGGGGGWISNENVPNHYGNKRPISKFKERKLCVEYHKIVCHKVYC